LLQRRRRTQQHPARIGYNSHFDDARTQSNCDRTAHIERTLGR
jgi:hypothetical protein